MPQKFHTQKTGGRPKATKIHQAICLANDFLRSHQKNKAERAEEQLQKFFESITDASHIRKIRRKQDVGAFSNRITVCFDNGMVFCLFAVGNGRVAALAWWPDQNEVIESEPLDFEQAVTQKGADCTIELHFSGNNADQLENLVKSPLYKR